MIGDLIRTNNRSDCRITVVSVILGNLALVGAVPVPVEAVDGRVIACRCHPRADTKIGQSMVTVWESLEITPTIQNDAPLSPFFMENGKSTIGTAAVGIHNEI